MQETRRASLGWLIWWSVRLAWSRKKVTRRRIRQQIWHHLGCRWRVYVPDTDPGSEVAIVQAVWLGASLASRSLVRYPLLPKRIKGRLTWLVRICGRTNGKAIVAAYLSWTWLRDMAVSSGFPTDNWHHTGG